MKPLKPDSFITGFITGLMEIKTEAQGYGMAITVSR